MDSRFGLVSTCAEGRWRYICTDHDEAIGEGVGDSEVGALERLVAGLRDMQAPGEALAAAELRLLARRLATPPRRDAGPHAAVTPAVQPGPSTPWRGLERRRRHRIPDPISCQSCNASAHVAVRVTIRTAYHVSFKCDRCGFVWSVEIPRS